MNVKDISRRAFLKGAAGTSAALGLSVLGMSGAVAEEAVGEPAEQNGIFQVV